QTSGRTGDEFDRGADRDQFMKLGEVLWAQLDAAGGFRLANPRRRLERTDGIAASPEMQRHRRRITNIGNWELGQLRKLARPLATIRAIVRTLGDLVLSLPLATVTALGDLVLSLLTIYRATMFATVAELDDFVFRQQTR